MDSKNNNQPNQNALAGKEKLDLLHVFTCSMAHEIRTPLAVANMAFSSIKEELPILIDAYKKAKEAGICSSKISVKNMEKLDQFCDDGRQAIRASFNVINMLTVKADISPLEKSDFSRQPVSECIGNAIEKYPFNEQQRENISVDCQNDFIILGHSIAMEHVIFNLVKNALWYAAGQEINIKTECGDDYNKLYFTDAGQGIPSEVLPHIFEQFYSKTPHGAGIGLYFCKVVMERMGGSIACDSKEGEYTKFTLIFPKADT